MAFKEALRLKPPVPSMPRRAVRDFTFKGYAIPAGTQVGVNPLFTHHMPDIWPERKSSTAWFTDEAHATARRVGAVWRRAHVLGPHFAYMQAKCFARHFPKSRSVAGARLQAGLRCGRSRNRGWPAGGVEGDLVEVRRMGKAQRAHHTHSWSRERVGTLRFAHPTIRVAANYFTSVVSCAPSSATNTAINSAGSVMLALAETRCTAPGGSKND